MILYVLNCDPFLWQRECHSLLATKRMNFRHDGGNTPALQAALSPKPQHCDMTHESTTMLVLQSRMLTISQFVRKEMHDAEMAARENASTRAHMEGSLR